ncbi:MAG: DUF4900 domain-containing protein [Bacteroidetes bacterium]|nr:DUF4900 domain-containing protein [Bacteroidota bacterium]
MLPQRGINYHNESQAKNITASMMDFAISEIRSNQDWKGANDQGFSAEDFLGGEGYLMVYDMDDVSDPTVDVPQNSVPSWDAYTRLVHANANYNGTTVETEVMLTQDSFSRYSYFTDVEPSNIYFFSQDVLFGPVHSNDRFNMAGTPTFHGRVTSPEDYYEYPYIFTDPEFLGGSNFNANQKPLPTDSQLDELRQAAQNGGLKYDNPIDIELFSNSQATIEEQIPGGGWQLVCCWRWEYQSNNNITHNVDLSNFNGVISSSENVSIRGELNGQLTVHSEKDIEITGDLTYADNPLVNENSDDILGLVGEGNVLVDEYAHQENGNRDLTIQASIMALEKSFSVEKYNEGSPRGELTLLGGIVQERRGAVGTFSGGNIRTGYAKNYSYDERLLRMHPPSFPRESFFNIFYWKDRVIVNNTK